jgi:hypothetical protein
MQLLQSKVNTKTAVNNTRCTFTLGSSEQIVSEAGKINLQAVRWLVVLEGAMVVLEGAMVV